MLREALPEHREMVRRWRNHPQVRAASLTTHEIGADEHERWWAAVAADPDRHVLLYERRGTPCGVVTFAGLGAGTVTWGAYVDVDGLGGDLLAAWIEQERELVAYAFATLGARRMRGEVLAGNQAVRMLHRRNGFRETGSVWREVGGILREVVQIELRSHEHAHR